MTFDKFVASLDVGTTTIRCYIFDSNLNIRGSASDQVELIYPEPGRCEIEPEKLWSSVIRTVRKSIEAANLRPEDIESLGISTQRATFITWDRTTGKVFHNFITWKDLRADQLVNKWNSSFSIKLMRASCHALHLVTRNPRFLAGSVLKLMNTQVTMRLVWMLENNKQLQEAVENKSALFGTLESWLLYRLRQGLNRTKYVEHISDITNATATGFYDPFTLGWASWALSMFSISADMLPKVVPNSYVFGEIDRSLFGAPIRIGSCISDQSASLWGSCCFEKGDIKVTLGTGSFLNVNTGEKCSASVHGLYPLVAWRYADKNVKNEEIVYCVEGASNDTGSIIKWANNFGLFDDPSASSDIACSVPDSDGTYFIPAFSGLGIVRTAFWKKNNTKFWKKAPVNDHQAASGIIGLRPSTENAHLVRAVLESIAFRVTQLFMCTTDETKFKYSTIRVDGGVSQNDFICQTLADLTGLNVERPANTEMSVLGAAFLSGLNTGIWRNRQELISLRKIERIFRPREDIQVILRSRMKSWERAVDRFKMWYDVGELQLLQKTSTSASQETLSKL